jgi:CrcB protein
MRIALAVAVASALGGLCRYSLGGAVARRNPSGFPWETFVVNISGCFVLGVLFVLFVDHAAVAPWVRAAVLVGFLGSYTTFSTWTLETWRLLEDGAYATGLANVAGSVAAGIAATYAGIVLGRLVT